MKPRSKTAFSILETTSLLFLYTHSTSCYHKNGARSRKTRTAYRVHSDLLIHSSLAVSRQLITAAPFQHVVVGSASCNIPYTTRRTNLTSNFRVYLSGSTGDPKTTNVFGFCLTRWFFQSYSRFGWFGKSILLRIVEARLFTGRMPFLLPNEQHLSTEYNNSLQNSVIISSHSRGVWNTYLTGKLLCVFGERLFTGRIPWRPSNAAGTLNYVLTITNRNTSKVWYHVWWFDWLSVWWWRPWFPAQVACVPACESRRGTEARTELRQT